MRTTIAGLLAVVVLMSGCESLGLKPAGSQASASSSTSQQEMKGTAKLPAAEGTVEFTQEANSNTGIEMTVKHLSHPEKLTPPAQAYVVWAKPTSGPDAKPQNIGALKVNDDLTGTLQTVTPLHGFLLQVTAEPSGEVQKPTGEPLLTATYNR